MLREFTRDPLTGLPNLIDAVARQSDVMRGENGTLIVFDLNDLSKLNGRWGRDVGDRLIQGLSLSIRTSIQQLSLEAELFRISGDDFLVSACGLKKGDADPFVDRVGVEFTSYIKSSGLPQATFRHASVGYPDDACSFSAAFVRLYRAISKSKSPDGVDWVEGLIKKLFQHFAETIDQLRFVQSQALTDDISGLANHRAAEQFLDRMLEQYNEEGSPFAVLFIDGDNLRQYNEMGYDRGNELIKRLGAMIQDATRSGDRVFRWLSGDEFLVILPGLDRATAQRVAERLRVAVAETSSSWTIPVTVSVGVAACPEDATTIDDLIRRAVRANTEAKQKGKNRVS